MGIMLPEICALARKIHPKGRDDAVNTASNGVNHVFTRLTKRVNHVFRQRAMPAGAKANIARSSCNIRVLKDKYLIADKVVVTAHRGFSGRYPENTIEALLAAVNLGVDIVEFDLRGTKDGVPIVLHDPTFDRTANHPGAPGDYLLSEIKTFQASYWQGAHDNGVKLAAPAVPGARIPTFEEVLNSVGDSVGLNIQVYDTTPAMLAEICRLYKEHDLYDRGYLTMAGFSEAECVRKLDKDIQLCVNESHGRMNAEALRQQKAFGCRYVQPYQNDVTPEFCRIVKDLGLCANMFYSNTAEDNQKYIRLGIAGILTDRPDILKATLRDMGLH